MQINGSASSLSIYVPQGHEHSPHRPNYLPSSVDERSLTGNSSNVELLPAVQTRASYQAELQAYRQQSEQQARFVRLFAQEDSATNSYNNALPAIQALSPPYGIAQYLQIANIDLSQPQQRLFDETA